MGDNVMGSFRTNRPPRGRRLGRGRGFRTFRLVRRWFRHESGGIERIAWPLTGSVCSFIVRSIPEGLMFREFSSIWEIQVKTTSLSSLVVATLKRDRNPGFGRGQDAGLAVRGQVQEAAEPPELLRSVG